MDLKKKLNLGATGAYPDGKLNKYDEGEIKMAVSNNGQIVRLDFGKPIAWLGFSPGDAKNIAALLMQHAERCTQTQN